MTEREILLFSLDGRRHAVDANSVRRIASSREPGAEWIAASVLGRSRVPRRGLVIEVDGQERTLAVDGVEGIERIPAKNVCPLPPFARATIRTAGICGIVVRGDELLFLVDLQQLIRESSKESWLYAQDE